MRVYIAPDYSKADKNAENGGIRRVVDAMVKYLPEFGVEIVHNPDQAEIICNHGAMLVEKPGIPSVNVCHGLYWSRQPWGTGFQEVNWAVVESMCHAVAHTVPSEWVNRAVRRGGYFYPETVYHGVDCDEFQPGQNQGYVLWNKARADFVSDPGDLMKVSSLLPHVSFLTTIGKETSNVHVLRVQPHEEMKRLVANAGVYLSTARETFGIGTLEALACGVPVAGWDCGGNSEIVIQGKTGYLAPWGNFEALAECVQKCIAERDVLSSNCIADAKTRWKWKPRIEQYANIFRRVYDRYYNRQGKPKVSIVVTAYKLDEYLPMCLESIRKQSYKDFECLVVDDAPLESTKIIVKAIAKKDKRFRYVPVVHNLGLPGARNYGLSLSNGLYIRHVDADDFLAPNAVELEAAYLDENWGAHIAYGHLEVTRADGTRILENGEPVRGGWPGEQFNWFMQMSHLNQLPSCSMVRREVYERVGGYRVRAKRAEDADFWCRATSGGFRAVKFTQAVTYFHRQRPDSKGALEWKDQGKEQDWTAWFPWRTGAADYGQGVNILRKYAGEHPSPYFVPFGAQGMASNPLHFWYVHDYAYPVVSVIITCGPGHELYLIDALDSVLAQTYPDWECIVVNDTGKAWDRDIMGAPWAKVVNMPKNAGAAAARNAGYKHARGKAIIWMDADDIWFPWLLEKMVSMIEHNKGVIFSDMLKQPNENKTEVHHFQEFDCSGVPVAMRYPGSSVLYPRPVVDAVMELQGGWDENIPGMEDWDFQVAVHHLGFCAYRVPEPLFVYRMWTTTKREKDYNNGDAIKAYMDQKWHAYRTGEKQMGCGCGSKKIVQQTPDSLLSSSGTFQNVPIQNTPSGQMVNVEYMGDAVGAFSIRSKVQPGVYYRFNNNDKKVQTVFLKDAEILINITNADSVPQYRVVTSGTRIEQNDPVAFLGQPIDA